MARTGLITGGSRGIGLAAARALHADGYRVALLARDAERMSRAAADLGEGTVWHTADVADAGQVREAVDALAAQLGGVDAIVTASGFGTHFTTRTPYDEAVAAWDDEVGVNLRGAFSEPLQTARQLALELFDANTTHSGPPTPPGMPLSDHAAWCGTRS